MSQSGPPMAGYSATTLVKKLGLAPRHALHVVDAPEGYRSLLSPLPEGVVFAPRLSASTDLTHLFVTSRARLRAALPPIRRKMRADAVVWVSWPKKASKVATDVTEDVVREVALPLGLVDVKVCAVDDVWSGLKLVVRKELR
ncbi:MAG TPA: hypothetical protein VNN99_04220 [Vicinamibacterales bacterium]|nr:hypothetical protein [Vicinamibacterales bacterium]